MLAEKAWRYLFSVSVTCCHNNSGKQSTTKCHWCTPLGITCADDNSLRYIRKHCWSWLFLFKCWLPVSQPPADEPKHVLIPKDKAQSKSRKSSSTLYITTANILLAKEDHMTELRIKGQESILHVLMWGTAITLQMTWIEGGMKSCEHCYASLF